MTVYAYRWYDPLTGRWLSRDPIGEKGGVNLYGFVHNQAIDGYDVNGLFRPYLSRVLAAIYLGRLIPNGLGHFIRPTIFLDDEEGELQEGTAGQFTALVKTILKIEYKGKSPGKYNLQDLGRHFASDYDGALWSSGLAMVGDTSPGDITFELTGDVCVDHDQFGHLRAWASGIDGTAVWRDVMDANSFRERYRKAHDTVTDWLIIIGEGSIDLVGDKVLGMDFPFTVIFRYGGDKETSIRL